MITRMKVTPTFICNANEQASLQNVYHEAIVFYVFTLMIKQHLDCQCNTQFMVSTQMGSRLKKEVTNVNWR